jgi:hypothetical protein
VIAYAPWSVGLLMDFRSPAERERDRLAILRSDRRTLLVVAPMIVRASHWLWVIWLVGLVWTWVRDAEGVILFVVGFVPVLIFWFLARLAMRAAAFADKNWK